jgi:ribosome maturation factor RimP
VQESPLEKRLRDRLEPQIEALGFECVELVYAAEAGRRVLRLTLDSVHGVTLDACAAVSRALGPVLEAMPDGPARYVLEVSSPGINRPLTKPEHFQRFLGERVKIRLRERLEGGMTVTGILRGQDAGIVAVETTVGTKHVPLESIARARLHRDLDALLRRPRGKPRADESAGSDSGPRKRKR